MKLANLLILSLFLAVAPNISFSAIQHSSCSILSLNNPAPAVESGPYFFSDRMVLQIPLQENPNSYFGNGPLLFRPESGRTPAVVFRFARKLTEQVWLNPDVDLQSIFEVGRLYTFVVMTDRLVIGRIPKNGKEYYSKHLVLANHEGVVFSGDIRKTEEGVLHFSNASGSYLPPPERLVGFAKFLAARFGVTNVVGFSMDENGIYHPVDLRTYEK